MDTEKAWEEFQANDSSIKKSESVQQDIQQILDTVTQIKTDVDQLKAEGPQANGPADTEPSLSAPEEEQPSPDMMGGMPPMDGEEPQAPMGDLNAQPEDGAASPMPEEPAPDVGGGAPPIGADAGPQVGVDQGSLGSMFDNIDLGGGMDEGDDDMDILLDTAREVKDPAIKQQLLAMAYQLIEDQKAPPAPPIEEAAPVMDEMPPAGGEQLPPGAEELLAAAMDANGDGMLSEEEIEPMMRSADAKTEGVQCDKPPADQIMSGSNTSNTFENSDEEKKDDDKEEDKKEESDEKKDDDDKSERPEKKEPGVNDELPDKEEDKDSLEELPEVTEVQIQTDAPAEEEAVSEDDNSEIDEIIDTILDDAKRQIKEQIVSTENTPFLLSTSEMMSIRRSGGSHRAFRTEPMRKAIEWPETFEGLTPEDKCRLFAKSFSQMPEAMQDNVITLMDTRLGSEATSAIFKSEGVDLDEYYEPVMKATQDHEGYTHGETVTGKNSDNLASDNGEGMTESCEESASTSNDDYQRGFETGKKHMDFLEKNVSGNGSAKKENYLDDISGALSKYKGKSVQNSTESLEACAKSATPEGVGIHIPTVNEMMAFKKSGTSMYTAISREAAEPHGIVKMDNEPEIPSVKDMFAKRFGHC